MPTRDIVLTDRQSDPVKRLVDSGRYQNASEVIRGGLRLIKQQETEDDLRLKALRKAADAGIADIEADRFQEFHTAESLRDHLAILTDDALADR